MHADPGRRSAPSNTAATGQRLREAQVAALRAAEAGELTFAQITTLALVRSIHFDALAAATEDPDLQVARAKEAGRMLAEVVKAQRHKAKDEYREIREMLERQAAARSAFEAARASAKAPH